MQPDFFDTWTYFPSRCFTAGSFLIFHVWGKEEQRRE